MSYGRHALHLVSLGREKFGLPEQFSREHDMETYPFLLAAGNAGIETATNIEVEKALIMLTLLVYAVGVGIGVDFGYENAVVRDLDMGSIFDLFRGF